MKKLLSVSLAALTAGMAFAQIQNLDGVTVVEDFYSQRMSLDGTQIVGESEDTSTVYYNITENQFYKYANGSFGRGYTISDNGWVVGCEEMDSDEQSNVAAVMYKGEIFRPAVFAPYVTSNIHSITPDGTRVCGVVGNAGRGMTNLPFYCDIDAEGNFGELQFLPVPEKDFFGNRPQYCSATWISADGKTIAGQVCDARGFFRYPIIYKENVEGTWSFSLPSEPLFNPDKLPLPEALDDFDEEYPDLVYPEPTQYMDPAQLTNWNAAYYKWEINNYADELSPYNNLGDFMTDEQIDAYLAAVKLYNEKVEEYNEKNMNYFAQLEKIVATSVFFVQNNMALSPNGCWLAAAGEYEELDSQYLDEPNLYYVPYLFNLESGEVEAMADHKLYLGVSQVLDNGNSLLVTPTSLPLPPRTWIYQRDSKTLQTMEEYVSVANPTYGEWYLNNLTGEIPVAETDKGDLVYEEATVTGKITGNADLSVLCGGVIGMAIGIDMYLSYIFTDLPAAGIEGIVAPEFNGTYNVYNLQGVKVLSTKDSSALNTLPKGIYIVNGKKLKL